MFRRFILGGSALLMGAALTFAPNIAQADAFPFFWLDDDIPPPQVIQLEQRLFREYTGCNYRKALAKYGSDTFARRACHGMLFP